MARTNNREGAAKSAAPFFTSRKLDMGLNPSFPRQVSALVVVDAPRKAATLEPALRRAGMSDFCILPIDVPLLCFPESVPPIGVNSDLKIVGRRTGDESMQKLLHAWAGKAGRVFVASDVDERGDLLAADIALSLQSHPQITRVRLRNLSFEGVVAAFSRPEPISVQGSWPALSRAVVDRSSRFVVGKRTGGRNKMEGWCGSEVVLASAICSIGRGKARITLALPAADAAGAFVAHLDVDIEDTSKIARLEALAAASIEDGVRVTPAREADAYEAVPWSHGDILFHLVQATDWSVSGIRESMRRLYEAGRLSYPDSDGRALSGGALSTLGRIAEDNGFRFDPERVQAFSRNGPHEHEAPCPVVHGVDITTPVGLLKRDDAVLSLITRHLLSCGQPQVRQSADTATLPEWACDYVFERTASLWLSPIQRRPFTSKVSLPDPVLKMLDLLRRYKLVLPGQESVVVERIMEGGLVNADCSVSEQVRAFLSACPPSLRDIRMMAAAEGITRAAYSAEALPDVVAELINGLGLASEVLPGLIRH
jgi:hypothetical protein